MSAKVRLTADDLKMTAVLNDSPAAAALAAALPLEGTAQTMGASVYFLTQLQLGDQGAVEEVEPGAIAYWPATQAVCIFYGSQPATPVVVVGKLDGDPKAWRRIVTGVSIKVEKA